MLLVAALFFVPKIAFKECGKNHIKDLVKQRHTERSEADDEAEYGKECVLIGTLDNKPCQMTLTYEPTDDSPYAVNGTYENLDDGTEWDVEGSLDGNRLELRGNDEDYSAFVISLTGDGEAGMPQSGVSYIGRVWSRTPKGQKVKNVRISVQ